MAAPRGRGLRPGGIVRAVVRLVLLVGVGFGVGLVFGLVTEEPELIAGHLRGESEPVPLAGGADEGAAAPAGGRAGQDVYATAALDPRPRVVPAEREEAASLPRVAAPAPGAAPAPARVVKGVPPAPLRATPLEVATPAEVARPVPETARRAVKVERASRPWAIQVGAFSEKRAAQRLAETLAGGYPVEVLPAKRDGGRWRVRVQPIATEDRARATAERLKREEGLPTWVTPMDEGRGRAEGRSG